MISGRTHKRTCTCTVHFTEKFQPSVILSLYGRGRKEPKRKCGRNFPGLQYLEYLLSLYAVKMSYACLIGMFKKKLFLLSGAQTSCHCSLFSLQALPTAVLPASACLLTVQMLSRSMPSPWAMRRLAVTSGTLVAISTAAG